MDALRKDIQYSIRMFLKSPGFTITAVAALALGIGGTTAIFSVVDAVLLKPLGVLDPDRLVVLATTSLDGDAASPAKFIHWRNESSVFQDVSAYAGGVTIYKGSDGMEQWQSSRVSADIFRCFGIRVLQGRTFTQLEDLPQGPPVAVISQNLWKRRFANDPRMLGKTISLDGELRTVIGIVKDVPALRAYGPASEVYVPFQIDPNTREQGDFLDVVARLKPGVALALAKARLQLSSAEYRAKFPNALGPRESFTAKPLRDDLVGGDRLLLLILSAAVSLVLLIACANVANLLLTRAAGRRREIAIRAAVGAGRGRMIRQLLTESALISFAGGALGFLLGYGGIRALLAINTAGLPMVGKHGEAVTIDWRIICFALLMPLITGMIFGMFPALQVSRTDLNSVLNDSSGRSGTGLRQNRVHGILVAGEVGLATILLIGSALLIRSFTALSAVKLGFESKNVVTMNVLLTGPQFSKSAAVTATVRSGLDRLRSLPGIVAAGVTCCLPLAQGTYDLNFNILDGHAASILAHEEDVGWAAVSPGYFETLRIPVRHGRTFRREDDNQSPAVVVINERMAKQYWRGRDPLGEHIVIGRGAGLNIFKDEPVRQIVGVAGDIRSEGLDALPRPILYVPQAQLTDAENAFFFHLLPMAWLVHTQREPRTMILAIREQLRQSTGLPVTDVSSMDHVVLAQTGRQQFSMLLMAIFGSTALLLAAIGIYGLMAYTVEQRRQEIGIRLALGAQPGDVRNMVVGQGMGLALVGLMAGLVAAWALARLIASLLFGVQAHDPTIFTAVPVVLGLVALVAVYPAANRASRITPIEALRYE
jgi:predicted permease